MKNQKTNRALNIGCSDSTRWIPNTEGLDIIDHGQKWVCDIFDFKPPYLYDVIFLHHVYEHFLDPVGLIDKISEFLAPKGVIDIRVPIFPYPQAFLDPTHRNFPVFPDTFKYYTKDSPSGHRYSKKEFEILGSEKDRHDWEGHISLKLL